ncbi:hypothetical protein SFOMI_1138 [Sphingobium fuliginis]|uniref:Uncharacterized protein n=1 Tax=Sphingobium fuliginis (strain ATCC 27551) TaxID=336203 RepID=A0A292ZCQ1_SPHSA|nr:hypothetical protein SFOMI_1138 [Sphingobium fuliginis]
MPLHRRGAAPQGRRKRRSPTGTDAGLPERKERGRIAVRYGCRLFDIVD